MEIRTIKQFRLYRLMMCPLTNSTPYESHVVAYAFNKDNLKEWYLDQLALNTVGVVTKVFKKGSPIENYRQVYSENSRVTELTGFGHGIDFQWYNVKTYKGKDKLEMPEPIIDGALKPLEQDF